MTWLRQRFHATSSCGRYEIAGRYTDGRFAWRGRHVQTDELVQSSADREYVERCCENHAALIDQQVPA